MKKNGIAKWQKPTYVVCELERYGESPDVFGFGGARTQLLEIKISHSDFLADKKKMWRINPENGLGELRSYLCMEGVISLKELPESWGLIYCNEKKEMTIIKEPNIQKSSSYQEMCLAASLLRRENIKPKIFTYKKYKNDID
ncbi:MAG: hypothetical protein FWC41_04380 [Firmicutes bacterium]|nr:hypothetical protein [Bacillota bacterium]